MADIYEEILKIKAEGKNAALATIIGTKGSTPREVGAKMLIQEDGKIIGTVGGGCMEAEAWQEAMKVIQEEKPRTVHFDLTGKDAEAALGRAHITVNKNAIPNDPQKPFVTSGIRIGSPAMTTRGFKELEAELLANLIADVLDAPNDEAVTARVVAEVKNLTAKFPVYGE